MEFRALNLFVRATGEALKEKIDLAMTSEILRMRFAHYLGEFEDDEGFLQTTYQAGVQVERLKTLEKARKTQKGAQPPKDDKRKDGQNKGSSDNTGKGRENTKETGRRVETQNSERKSQYGQLGRWESRDAALAGMPEKEKEEYRRNRDDCWRCGRSGHRTYECFSFNTKRGTALAPAPWETSAVVQGKQKRSEEPETTPLAKQQKVAAVETIETDAIAPLWEQSDSDF